MNINISGLTPIDDPEYRYKMPKINGKIEGRGNGIKTVLTNCLDVANALHRNPSEVCKFFGCELGAQSKYDANTERAVVNGAFDTKDLQSMVHKYVELFVLCPQCRLPETKYKYRGQTIFHKCLACGAEHKVDMMHKLTNFIIKEHAAEKRNKKGKDDKKKKSKSKHQDGEEDSPKKKDKKKKEKKSKKEKSESNHDKPCSREVKEEEIEWHTDLSEEAVLARMQEAHAIEEAARSALSSGVDVEDGARLDTVPKLKDTILKIQDKIRKKNIADCNEELETLISKQMGKQDISMQFASAIVFQSLMNETLPVGKYASVFKHLSQGGQFHLLAQVEYFCTIAFPNATQSYPLALKLLYDHDILDEENILSWKDKRGQYAYRQVSDPDQLQAILEPFVTWLQQAEEESQDEESD